MAEGIQHVDRLTPFIGNSALAKDVLAKLETDGYVVLPDVFTQAEAESAYHLMWRWVETVSPGIKRGRPETWRRRSRDADPWPSKQRDMMQMHQAGWVFTELREHFGERVFEQLYGTPELHCSKDGFTLQRPTDRPLENSPNDHFDQSGDKYGLQCIQGSVALTDQDHDDGCFLCWPGSHKHHRHLTSQRRKGGRSDFIILDDFEKEYLHENGIRPVRVPVKKGTVILWRSDLVHKGAPPIGQRDNFRGVVYVCMMPAVLTSEAVYKEKQRAYLELKTSSHWPCFEEWFKPGREAAKEFKPFFRHPPTLTCRQRLLYGLDRYPDAAVRLLSLPSHTTVGGEVHCRAGQSTGTNQGESCCTAADDSNSASQGKTRRWAKKALNPPQVAQPAVNVASDATPHLGYGSPEVALPSLPNDVRKLRKALREIQVLETEIASGRQLLRNQQWKLDRKASYEQRLAELEAP